jgi:hypothetical protein
MAMDFLGTPATLTSSERVNSAAGREFTCMRQSLSSAMFVMTMCLRSWMGANILKVPTNRQQVATALIMIGSDLPLVESVVEQLELEQNDWDEEVLDDGVIQLLHQQFDDVVFEADMCDI